MLNTVKTKKTVKKSSDQKSEPMSNKQIETNIFFLENLKRLAFNNDHPGIDKIVQEMKKQVVESTKPTEPTEPTKSVKNPTSKISKEIREGKQFKGGVGKKPTTPPPTPPKKGV